MSSVTKLFMTTVMNGIRRMSDKRAKRFAWALTTTLDDAQDVEYVKSVGVMRFTPSYIQMVMESDV